MESELISADEAAKYLGVSTGTLAVWRSTKRYFLPFVKVGHLVRYRPNDLSEFVLRRVVNMPPTNEKISRGRLERQRKSA